MQKELFCQTIAKCYGLLISLSRFKDKTRYFNEFLYKEKFLAKQVSYQEDLL